MSKFMAAIKNGVSNSKCAIKKCSPEILVGLGIVGIVTATVMACKATLKVDEIIEETHESLEKVHTVSNDPDMAEKYTPEDARKDTAVIYMKTGLKFLKLYGPSIAICAASIFMICKSHKIMKQRNLALASAYAALDKGFKAYQERVSDRFGEEVEKEIRYGVKAEEFVKTVTDKDGKEKSKKEIVKVVEDPYKLGPYTKCFDESCYGWTKDPEQNLMFLHQQEDWANNQLRARGYLLLNEVYRSLGIPETNEGMIIGWRYRPGDNAYHNCVDFGIYNIHRKSNREFVNGYERSIFLDFNVDGNIYGTL